MMRAELEDSGMRVQVRVGGKERVITVPEARVEQLRRFSGALKRGPFVRRSWHELLFFLVDGVLSVLGLVFVVVTLAAGTVLAVTFVGLLVLASCVRGARGIGGFHRGLAKSLLGEHIEDPPPFVSRPGLFGWLQSALRDRTGWRAIAYSLVRAPLVGFGVWFALSVWIDAFFCLTYPLFERGRGRPIEFGVVYNLFPPGFFSVGSDGVFHGLFIVVTGVVLLFLAPWPTRLIVSIDRRLMHVFLAPDALSARVRSLEQARAQTLDASAAVLRRIERNLHDGTQAQLVAVAMRLGQAKEKLAEGDGVDLDQVRRLVTEAHQGAKDAIVELRDLARGIHPPALDTGLEGALTTLASRSSVPTEVTVSLQDRPTPAIEAIAYFSVAELLANVAQHAQASVASVSCVQHGQWLRVVVRDDGRGGAQPSLVGSASSGLRGLNDRVGAVDGTLQVTSPSGGPTVVTVDLPMHA
jgi:signal transduction histidine kinase